MRIAIFSDIHGNLDALQAVLLELQTQQIDQMICCGDLVGYYPDSNEVIELLKKYNVEVVQGNHDEKVGSYFKHSKEDFALLSKEELQASASIAYIGQHLSEENKVYLQNLPRKIVKKINGFSLLFVHGSLTSNKEYLYEEVVGSLSYPFEFVCSGHTHLPYVIPKEYTLFVNAGSVGKPKHGNHNAVYLLLEINKELKCSIHEVSYDVEKTKIRFLSNNAIDTSAL